MENVSLRSDVWKKVTSSSEDNNLQQYLGYIRDLALEIIYIIMGTIGVLDNLFVIITFALFIKITDKVRNYRVAQKIGTFLYALTSSNINRFSKLSESEENL